MGEQQLAAVAGAALELLAPAEPVEVAGGGLFGAPLGRPTNAFNLEYRKFAISGS